MSSASKSEGDDSSISVRQKALLSKGSRSAQHWNISMSHSLMMSSLLSPSCARMDSLNKKKKKCFGYKRLFISSSSGLMLQKKQKTNQNKQKKKKKTTTTISTWHIQLTSKSLTAFESATSACLCAFDWQFLTWHWQGWWASGRRWERGQPAGGTSPTQPV